MPPPGKGGRHGNTLPRPLIDRFFKNERNRYPPATMSREEYLAAVARDVNALLNTRSPLLSDTDDDSPLRRSVAGYGLPDFSHLSPDSSDDLWLLSAMLRETLERFEPRLENIRTDVREGENFQKAVIHITADVRRDAGRIALDIDAKELLNRN